MNIHEIFTQYVAGILRNYQSKLISFNYMPDHVHMLINLGVEQPLAKVIGAVKQSTSLWLKKDGKCPYFEKWSKEYYGVSLSPTHKDAVENYIVNQQNHHSVNSFSNEIEQLIIKAGLTRYPDSFYE